jgi:hypothetical protein
MHRKQCWYLSPFLSLSLFAFAFAFALVSILLFSGPVFVGIVMSVKELGSDYYPYAEALKARGDISYAKLASLG